MAVVLLGEECRPRIIAPYPLFSRSLSERGASCGFMGGGPFVWIFFRWILSLSLSLSLSWCDVLFWLRFCFWVLSFFCSNFFFGWHSFQLSRFSLIKKPAAVRFPSEIYKKGPSKGGKKNNKLKKEKQNFFLCGHYFQKNVTWSRGETKGSTQITKRKETQNTTKKNQEKKRGPFLHFFSFGRRERFYICFFFYPRRKQNEKGEGTKINSDIEHIFGGRKKKKKELLEEKKRKRVWSVGCYIVFFFF